MSIKSEPIIKNASVDNVTIDTNANGEIEIKNLGVTTNKLNQNFILIDNTPNSINSMTFTTFKTYTFKNDINKILKFSCIFSVGFGLASFQFFKNGINISQQLQRNIIGKPSGMNGTSYLPNLNFDYGANAFNFMYYEDLGSSFDILFNYGEFKKNDVLTIKWRSNNNAYIYKKTLEVINKNTTTSDIV